MPDTGVEPPAAGTATAYESRQAMKSLPHGACPWKAGPGGYERVSPLSFFEVISPPLPKSDSRTLAGPSGYNDVSFKYVTLPVEYVTLPVEYATPPPTSPYEVQPITMPGTTSDNTPAGPGSQEGANPQEGANSQGVYIGGRGPSLGFGSAEEVN